ncbi:hypothetical protein [Streptomyces gardneri]|uniref:Uncharacterized protein n=1 Tax=Streptomyces gardneri TaxID=66892 RepID=A0A4Y3RX77_9ACTN|nr:hypothetical protein [Streptomyces gardneri]GEB62162.1 hypothetical protein SGA01_77670 [Streptomyces gardneri]GHH23638.1 hypothetical protein GCM10017674_80380 [Streptomyces gardneri]
MDSKAFSGGLAELRELRDEIKPLLRDLTKLQAELDKLQTRRDRRIVELGAFEKAKADRIATSAGVSVIDVVALVPSLGPQSPPSSPADAPANDPRRRRSSGAAGG